MLPALECPHPIAYAEYATSPLGCLFKRNGLLLEVEMGYDCIKRSIRVVSSILFTRIPCFNALICIGEKKASVHGIN